MATGRRRAALAAQIFIAGAVILFAGREIARSWRDVSPSLAELTPRWDLLAVASVVVLAAYLLLVQIWRAVVGTWSQTLGAADALRIWFVSNLGKYVPGKVWQIGAMGALARAAGVSPVAAVGSSLVINLVNLLTGFAIVLVAGAQAIEVPGVAPQTARLTAIAIVAAGAGALLLAPTLVPKAIAGVGRVLGRDLALAPIPTRALVLAAAGTASAWILYGIAFQLFVAGLGYPAAGATSAYLAVYTGSYLVGYLVLFAPGGVGFREASLVLLMPKFALATTAEAALVAVASRLWLTVLEVLPGILFLAFGLVRGRLRPETKDASS